MKATLKSQIYEIMVNNKAFKYMVIHDVQVIIAYYDISKFPDKDYSDLLNYFHKKHGKKYSVAYAILDKENRKNILLTPLLSNYEDEIVQEIKQNL